MCGRAGRVYEPGLHAGFGFFATGSTNPYNVPMPATNKKLFAVTFIVAVVAILGFVFYVRNVKTPEYGVDNGHGTTSAALPLGNIEEEEPAGAIDAFAWTDVYFTTLNAFPDGKGDGAIGCGDGLVAYRIPVDENNIGSRGDLSTFLLQKIQDPSFFAEAKAAYLASFDPATKNSPITILSGPKDKQLELHNAFKGSRLALQSLKDVPGAYEIKINGQATLGGVCDQPRLKAQLQKTMESGVATTSNVTVFLNGKKI